jgi:phosphoribosylaminoimidazole carboxylase PurE protein
MSERTVLIVMGSESDLSAMKPAEEALRELGVGCEVAVASAHRTPERAATLAAEARGRGVGAIIAGAGLAHHLAGALAARTTLPIIAVPLASGALQGVDSLLSAVQMPPNVPVAVVGVGAARNAGVLAAEILAVCDDTLAARLDAHRKSLAAQVDAADERVRRSFRGEP